MDASQLVTRPTRHSPNFSDELTVTNYIGYVVLSVVLSKLLVNLGLGHGDLFSNY